MKPFFQISLLMLAWGVGSAWGQDIRYEVGSFHKILKRAKAERKLVFVDFIDPLGRSTLGLTPHPLVIEKFNGSYLNVRADADDGDEGKSLAHRFGVLGVVGSIAGSMSEDVTVRSLIATGVFVDGGGNVLHRFGGVRSGASPLVEARQAEAEAALRQLLWPWDRQYSKRRKDAVFLHAYLRRREQVPTLLNTDLLAEYLALLPPDSLRSRETLRLMIQTPISVTHPAFDLLLAHRFRVAEEGPKGIATLMKKLNGAIFASLEEAKATRNAGLFEITRAANRRLRQVAPELSAFSDAYLQWNFDVTANHVARFVRQATAYFEEEVLGLSSADLARLDSLEFEQFREPYRTGQRDSTRYVAAFEAGRAFRAPARRFANELELAARLVYQHSPRTDDLARAATWANKAIELDPRASRLDAYALVVERLGQQAVASRVKAAAQVMAEREETEGSSTKP